MRRTPSGLWVPGEGPHRFHDPQIARMAELARATGARMASPNETLVREWLELEAQF